MPLKKAPIVASNNNGDDGSVTHFTVCSICGQCHNTHKCAFLVDVHHVKDTLPLPLARATLPYNLEIIRMADSSNSIITKKPLKRGTTFGPFVAKRNWVLNPVTTFPIRIFGATSNESCYLDYSDEYSSNWMSFIQPASNAKEQNLICYQTEQDIFYTAARAITSGEQLRVWYAPYYAEKMEKPLHTIDCINVERLTSEASVITRSNNDQVEVLSKEIAHDLAERLPAEQLGARTDKDHWTCRICAEVINSVVSYAKHLMEHYKPLAGCCCSVCNKKFHTWSQLTRHKSVNHPDLTSKHETIGIPTTANQQQQNEQILLNVHDETSDAMKNILEKESQLVDINNTNNLLQNSENLMENSSFKSILENQCLNMNLSLTDAILSDNLSSDLKFVEELSSDLLDISPEVDNNINRAIDSLECDICDKKFVKPEYLYRHLRKHTGEFMCSMCLVVFARKENLQSHICQSQRTLEHLDCPYCQKQFFVKKYLKRHMLQHLMLSNCKSCRRVFNSAMELREHKCNAPKHICEQCGKKFTDSAYLKRHVKTHTEPKPVKKPKERQKKETKEDGMPVICEKCGEILKTSTIFKQHLRSHGERMYECDVCQRKFHRIGVLNEHKKIHQSNQIPCNLCGKFMRSKKALAVHLLVHGNKKIQCDKCDRNFFQRCNYLKHYRQIHAEMKIHKCPHCTAQFKSLVNFKKHVDNHTKPAENLCKLCPKSYHRVHQLKRHIQSTHSGITYRCPFCDMTVKHRHSIKRHFERHHACLRDEWDKPGFINELTVEASIDKDLPRETTANSKITSGNFVNDVPVHLDTQLTPQVAGNSSSEALSAPQLIGDGATLAESVLNNTYIFGEGDGDIMFYVLATPGMETDDPLR